jgi:hypothetical protein
MTPDRTGYVVPPKPADPKQRYVRVTDPDEINAVIRSGLRDPIGAIGPDGVVYAEAHSLAQFRGQNVEFTV